MDEAQQLEPQGPSEWLLSKVDELNVMLNTDPTALDWLVKYEVRCGTDLAHHGNVTTCYNEAPEPFYSVGFLGVLNAVLAEPPWYIVADFEEDSVVGFRLARFG